MPLRRKSILFVTTIARTIEAFLLPYAAHLRARGWRVDGAAAGISSCAACGAGLDAVHDVPFSRQPARPGNVIAAPRAIHRVVTAGNYGVVHVHTPVAAFVTRFALRRLPPGERPVVIYTAHGFHFHPRGRAPANAAFRAAERLAARWTDYLVVINEEDAAASQRLWPERADRVLHMPGIGVDTARFAPGAAADAGDELRAALGIGPGGHLVCVVGEVSRNKRPGDVLRAISRIGRPGVHVAFAGGGAERRYRRLAARLGVADRAHFLGTVDDVRPVLAAADVLVQASEREGLPISVVEAMSMGVPVVGTDIRGTRDLLRSGAGTLVPPRRPDLLAAAVVGYLDDPARRAAHGARGRSEAATYDIRPLLGAHEDLYERARRERRETP